ncbi:hypothetical protein ACHAWF_003336 [Thalassiosira exigua]
MTMTAASSRAFEAGWPVAVPEMHAHGSNDRAHALDVESFVDEKKDGEDGRSAAVEDVPRKEQKRAQAFEEKITNADEVSNLLDEAESLGKDDKLLLAAHLLRGVDEKHLRPIHRELIKEAAILESLLQDNGAPSVESSDCDGGWVRQGRRTGRHNFSVDYKLNDSNGRQDLSCRIETIIPSDLIVPFLSVLNESELYSTWLPNYDIPRLKVAKSEKWRQTGRCSQVVNVEVEIPWPLAARQVILKAVACDNIDAFPEEEGDMIECLGRDGGRIIIRLQSLDTQNSEDEGLNIPPARINQVRMKVRGGFTIEKCPTDHPLAKHSMKYDATTKPELPAKGDLILVTFSFCVDPNMTSVPKSLINFFLRTAMGQMWNIFLNVAEDVKDGKRPRHSKAIEKKRCLYDWIEERTRVMLGQVP